MGNILRILILVLMVGLSFSGQSQEAFETSDLFFSWSPKFFKIKPEVMRASLDELEASNDSSTIATFSSYSDFKSDYIRFFTNGYISHLANRFAPGSLEGGYESNGIAALFYEIKRIGGWLLKDVFNGTYPRSEDHELTYLKYGYCEANPGSTESICAEGIYTPLYALIVRSVSTEAFIKNACGPFTDVVIWRFGWNLVNPSPTAPKKDEVLRSLDNVLGALDYLKKSETWDVSEVFMKKLDQFSLPWQVERALRRRYYDRGPSLMANLAECAAGAKQKIIDAISHVVPDPVVTEKMDNVFGFIEFQLPYDVTDVKNPFGDSMISSDFSSNQNLYRLFRQLPDSYPVVIDLNFKGARIGSYDDEIVIESGNMPQLINFVNLIDQRFHYQILTDKDVEKGIYQYGYNPRYEFGGLGNYFCVLNQEKELISITVDSDNGTISSERVDTCLTDRYLIERRLK